MKKLSIILTLTILYGTGAIHAMSAARQRASGLYQSARPWLTKWGKRGAIGTGLGVGGYYAAKPTLKYHSDRRKLIENIKGLEHQQKLLQKQLSHIEKWHSSIRKDYKITYPELDPVSPERMAGIPSTEPTHQAIHDTGWEAYHEQKKLDKLKKERPSLLNWFGSKSK